MSTQSNNENKDIQASDEPEESDLNAVPRWQRSRLWRWGFRLTAAIVLPTLLLFLLEGGLRLFGYGQSTAFTNKQEVSGIDCHVPNPSFGWRYFPREIAREATWFSYPVEKDPNTIRVFVLGGSAAQGDPEPSYGVTRMLGKMLKWRYPEKDFEVINAAMTAINSHVVRDIAGEVVEHEPDILVIYMGNNEVVGPYGASNQMIPMSDKLALIRASLFVKSTRIGQLFSGIVRAQTPDSEEPLKWKGMEMFLESALAADAPELETVYGHFRKNLTAILASAGNEQVPVLLSTVAVNLRDCAPFASAHRYGLAEDALEQWKRFYDEGSALQLGRDYSAAIDAYRAAAAIDDRHANLHYRLGQCLIQLQKTDDAAAHFVLARDLDTLRFRADTRINKMIREAAAEAAGVTLVDAEQELAQQAPHRLPGSEVFYEHVHFNFHGNYLLACSLLGGVERQLQERLGDARRPVPSEQVCRDLLAYSEYDLLTVLQMIIGRLQQAPFTNQLNHEEQYAAWKQQAEAIDQMLRQQEFAQGTQRYAKALQAAPDDPWLHYRHGFFQLNGSGDFAGAEKSFQESQRLGLEPAELWLGKGMARYQQGRRDAAIADFRKGLEIDPEHWRLLSQLGYTLSLEGNTEEGIAMCERAVEIAPDRPGAQQNLGMVYLANGRMKSAVDCFKKAIKLGGESASSLVNLGRAKAGTGQVAEAMKCYEKALQLSPGNFHANRELGGVRLQSGDRAAALQHFSFANQAKPGDFASANNLAWLLATIPNPSLRNGAKAVKVAEAIAAATGHRDPSVLDTLAAAYAEAGQFGRAVATAQKALSLAPPPELATQIRERLQLYQSGRPFHEH